MRLAASPAAPAWLALLAFCEGVFFPIPPDVMLMPMVLANRRRAFLYAAVCTLASLAGGSTGYAIGYFLTPVGRMLLALTGHGGGMAEFQSWYGRYGLFMIVMPLPYKIVAVASGLARFSYPAFILASVLVRSLRFAAVAALLRTYGEPIRHFVEKRLGLVTAAVTLALVLAFVVLKALH